MYGSASWNGLIIPLPPSYPARPGVRLIFDFPLSNVCA